MRGALTERITQDIRNILVAKQNLANLAAYWRISKKSYILIYLH